MKIRFHADDFGISRPTTEAILHCHDQGPLTGTSVMTNGGDFDYAMREAAKRPELELTIHLTLTEGPSVADPGQLPSLVNEAGQFHHSFVSLWKAYLLGNAESKTHLRDQIRVEWSAQIQRFVDHVGPHQKIRLDSHHHVHTIPFIFDTLLDLTSIFPVSHLRIPRETFFFSWTGSSALKIYLGANLIKHYLLRWLTRAHSRVLDSRNIHYNTHFIGVLFTGNMSKNSVECALSALTGAEDDLVEILFHPGKGKEREALLTIRLNL